MNSQSDTSPQLRSPANQVLFKIVLAVALILSALLLVDCLLHQPIIQFLFDFSWYGWYVLMCLAAVLAFLLSLLLCAIHDIVLPSEKAWSLSDRITNGGLFFIFAFFLVPIYYFAALFLMIHHGVGNGGE